MIVYTLAAAFAGVALQLGPAAAAEPAPGSLDAARAALQTWHLAAAEETLAADPRPGEDALGREILRARLDLQRSRYDEVVKRLDPLVVAHPEAFEARVVLGRALLSRGEHARGVDVLDAMAEAYNDDKVTRAEDLMWLGVGLQLTDYVKNANQVFKEALDKDPELDRARILWADLFISKYNYQDSDELFKEVLARRPTDFAATLGRARIDILSDNELTGAREKLERLVAAAPDCVPAHNLLALVELQNERPEAAAKRLVDESLRVAPNDLDALALLGTAYALADDDKRYAATEKRALKVNPRFAAFYTTVAEHAARVHRYREAVALNERALALDREHWKALAGLGIGMSRLGDDDKAIAYLNEAFDGDPYDVRTYNLLAHFYDDVKKHYTWVDAGPMRLRVARAQEAVLTRYLPPFLKDAYRHFSKKYGFTPDAPLHVEIFPDRQTFAVRSTGLPQLSAHGICFGHVITSRSPSDGNFNWGEVLWHELAHVYHIQLSQSRVPRWFTEGLAVYESLEGRPNWDRENDPELLAYLDAGKLRGVADFNLAFTQAKSMQDILVAYYHAYKVAKFVDQTWGFARMRKMLAAWGDKLDTPEVLKKALGVTVEEFDQRFFAWLRTDLGRLVGQLRLDSAALVDRADAVKAAAKAAPGDADKQADAAVVALAGRDEDGALIHAEAALTVAPTHPRALYVRAIVAMRRKDLDRAEADLKALVDAGHDSVDIASRQAELATACGDSDAALAALARAVQLDPKDARSYAALIAALDKAGKADEAFTWRARLADVDQMDPTLVGRLLDDAAAHDAKKADVVKWGEQAMFIAPFSAELHVAFARELERVGEAKRAHFEAESALVIDPQNAAAKALLK
ncbi:MAG: tetratricopeptide repeat protein [Deltaproteobacteria bacterium]|nr:MAG: tetratricopeptide repeat protein [Deltaproteobacteria bacterium]